MMNVLRFFTRPLSGQVAQEQIARFSRSTLSPLGLQVGRMPAEMPMAEIKSELLKLVRNVGWELVRDQIMEESHLLVELEQQINTKELKVQQIVDRATKRTQSGYSVGGLFWEHIQAESKDAIPSKEEYKHLKEQYDWLRARQAVFAALAPEHQASSTFRV